MLEGQGKDIIWGMFIATISLSDLFNPKSSPNTTPRRCYNGPKFLLQSSQYFFYIQRETLNGA